MVFKLNPSFNSKTVNFASYVCYAALTQTLWLHYLIGLEVLMEELDLIYQLPVLDIGRTSWQPAKTLLFKIIYLHAAGAVQSWVKDMTEPLLSERKSVVTQHISRFLHNMLVMVFHRMILSRRIVNYR